MFFGPLYVLTPNPAKNGHVFSKNIKNSSQRNREEFKFNPEESTHL